MTEADALSDMYVDYECNDLARRAKSDEEALAELIYHREHMLNTLIGGVDNTPKKYVIVQQSRKDSTTLMLVDRRKSRDYWWTHDFSIALVGTRRVMRKRLKSLRYNNVRLVEYNKYMRES